MPERHRAVGVALLAEAVALAVVVALRPPDALPAPVVATTRLGPVALGPALVVLLAWAGAARLVPRIRNPALAETALTAPVTVFLVAQLNGIAEVVALVPLYALTSAAWLLAGLQPRVRVVSNHPLLPLCCGAAVGIVPWGVIALQEVAGAGPSAGVRVVTLLALAGQTLVGVLLWRAARGRPATVSLGAAVAVSVTAWSAALLS